ncbi:MAG TPA: type III pantothenate kinase [bacterium]|nr:type III pantothenate kinase [bacterium]
MIWAILAGNTRTVAALMKDLKVLRRKIVPTQNLKSIPAAIRWAKALRRSSPCEGIIVASVVPPLDPVLKKSLWSAFGQAPEFIGPGRNSGIPVRVKKPSQVGADRLANAVAARELYGVPSIVVDYGTGTTFDVVDRKGTYRGGAILPGLGISLRALHDFTAKIPLVKFEKVSYAVGRTTEEAVRSGIYHGAIGTTRELLQRTRKQIGAKAPAIATGGWCWAFKGTGFFTAIEPDLTLQGMALIWRKRHA